MSGIIGQRGAKSGIVGPTASNTPAFCLSGDSSGDYSLVNTYPYSSANDVDNIWGVTYNIGDCINTGSGQAIFTPKVAGYYFISWRFYVSNFTDDDEMHFWLQSNGSSGAKWLGAHNRSSRLFLDITFTDYFSVGNTCYPRAINWAAARGVISSGAYYSTFMGHLLS